MNTPLPTPPPATPPPPPLTSPATDAASPEAAILDAVSLILVPGLGPARCRELTAACGSAGAVIAAGAEVAARVARLPRTALRALESPDALRAAARTELQRLRARGLIVITPTDARYPGLLHAMPDPPLALFVRGELRPDDALGVAIVGARAATAYGRRVAERLGAELADAGVTVVSGLARGVDGAAHRGALAAGGRTLAVIGSGLGRVYPPEHGDLAAEIADGRGAIISELPLDAPPRRHHFPIRNRVVAGLVRGVVVVEAGPRSGALITARLAAELGREVLAVPGPVDDEHFAGSNDLLVAGAGLCRSARDVLDAVRAFGEPVPAIERDVDERLLGVPGATATRPRSGAQRGARGRRPSAGLGGELCALLSTDDPVHTDELVRRTGRPANEVALALLDLSLSDEAREVGQDRWTLA